VGAAYLDPWAYGWRDHYEQLFATPGFRAVKLECSEATGLCGFHPDARLDDPKLAWLWADLEARGTTLPLDLGAIGSRSYPTEAVRAIAERPPALKIAIAPLAQPTPAARADPARWRLWEQQIDLGRLPNVWFDNSALPAYLQAEGYPFPSAAQYLRLAIERI